MTPSIPMRVDSGAVPPDISLIIPPATERRSYIIDPSPEVRHLRMICPQSYLDNRCSLDPSPVETSIAKPNAM